MVANAYSRQLTSCKTDSISFRICSYAYVIPPTSLRRLPFPPMRSHGSSSFVLALDGIAPLVFPLYFSSFEVSSFGERTKGSY